MASSLEFTQYVAEQLSGAGEIIYKKMFGEYGLYCDGKLFANVSDDQLFIKITDAGSRLFPDLPEAPPYPGAKDYFLIENVDDRDFLTALTLTTCQALPEAEKKRGK